MATSGDNIQHPDAPGKGAAYGFPENQIRGHGGVAHIEVSANVADRFEAAKKSAHEASAGAGPTANLDDKHKSGMEVVTDRARDLTEVTKAKVQSGGTADTRQPDIGFPE